MDPHTLTQLLGYSAATLTTLSFVPQALHTFRSGEVAGISVGMYSIFTVGVAMWLVYGMALGEWPIVIANAITFALAAGILGMTVRARRRARRLAGEIRMDC
jgi:MtN3 and saliva related transmembrane protein